MQARHQVEAGLQRVWQATMPTAAAIAERVVKKCLADCGHDPAWIRDHFSTLTENVQVAAQQQFLEAQQEAVRTAFAEVVLPLAGEHASPADIVQVVGDNFYALESFFVGLAQGRRPHAKAFELLVCKMIALTYPGAAQAIFPGQPDFIFPSIGHFRREPNDALVFSVKKTVRDRWRQMLTDSSKPLGLFIATLDEEITQRELAEMLSAQVWVVVPERVKAARGDYKSTPNVISFEYFLKVFLDPAVERWRAAGIVCVPLRKPSESAAADLLPPGFNPSVRASGLRRTLNLLQASLFD
jgi:hypothetical protein